jgi:hypothetical protein
MKQPICTEHGQEIPAGNETFAVIVEGDDRLFPVCADTVAAVPPMYQLPSAPPNGAAVYPLVGGAIGMPRYGVLCDHLWAFMPTTAARALN